MAFVIERKSEQGARHWVWPVVQCEEKLADRARLAGARTFDELQDALLAGRVPPELSPGCVGGKGA